MTLLYVACADDRSIHTMAMDPASGALRQVAVTIVPGPDGTGSSQPLALSPDRRFLYAAVRQPPYPMSCFAVGPGGALTWLGAADLPHAMAYIVTSTDGRQVLGASYPGGLVSCSQVGADGVALAPAQVLTTPPRAHCIVPGPAAGSYHVPCLGGDTILHLSLEAGQLVERGRADTHAGAGPRHIRFSADGRFGYCANELDGTIDVWSVDAAGNLHAVQTLAMLPPGTEGRIAAADLHLTPDGTLVFASERLTNILTGWRRDAASGMLTHACTVAAEPVPRGFAIDPSGRFLLCAGQESGQVATYAIDPSGMLTRLAAVAVGPNPNWIEILG
jgi:6-phosphogluconolactonase